MLKLLSVASMLLAMAYGQVSTTSVAIGTTGGAMGTTPVSGGESGESTVATTSSSGESLTTSAGGESSTTTSSESSGETSSTTSTTTTTSAATTTTTTTAATTTTASTTYAVQNRNNVQSNYYYGSFDTASFAYAVDQCTAYSLQNGYYMQATCLDTAHIKINIYSASNCSATPISTNTYTSANATFNCSGVNTYAKVTISALSCPASASIYAALDECVLSGSVYSSVYCSGTNAELQYYTASSCADSAFYVKRKSNATCNFLLTLSSVNVYGQLDACVTGATTTTTVETTASSPANFFNFNVFIVGLLFIASVLRL